MLPNLASDSLREEVQSLLLQVLPMLPVVNLHCYYNRFIEHGH
jgi:hypothetical protein